MSKNNEKHSDEATGYDCLYFEIERHAALYLLNKGHKPRSTYDARKILSKGPWHPVEHLLDYKALMYFITRGLQQNEY